MRESTCHRCGARARRGPSSRAICARCAAEPFRGSVPELDELTRSDATPVDERISLELIHSIDTGLAAPILERSRRSIPWKSLALVLLLGVTVGVAGTATVGQVVARDAKPEVAIVLDAKTGSAVEAPAEEPDPPSAVADPEDEAPAPVVEEVAPPAPSPAPRRTRVATSRSAATPSPAPAVTSTPAPRPVSSAPLPTRAAVRQAFLAVHDDVQQCGDVEQIGTVVIARVVFSGETGQVLHAQVTDANVAPEIRSCVARVARGAEVSRFGQDTLTVTYPFTL